jgi:ABC-2 type transport system permease protein
VTALATLRRGRAPSPYGAAARSAFRRFSSYRGATLAGVVTNTVFGFVYAGVYAAVHASAGAIGGFTGEQTVLYVFTAQAFLMMTGAFGDRELSDRVRTGDVAADLYRPVDFQGWWFAHEMGKAAFFLLGRGVPPFVVGVVVLGLPLPADVGTWAAFALMTSLGVVLAFTVRFLANLSAFALVDATGVVVLVAFVQTFLAGHIVPLYFLPDAIEQVVRVLPFAGITAFPAEVLAGGHQGSIAGIVALQLAWIVLLGASGRAALHRARRRLEVQGG